MGPLLLGKGGSGLNLLPWESPSLSEHPSFLGFISFIGNCGG